MKILQLTVHYSPNIGGVETHLDDLVRALIKRKHKVDVLTYRPLMTKTKWKMLEISKSLYIVRLPYLSGLFYTLINSPVLEFLYLTPGLFIALPIMLFLRRPDVIHTHGLVSGFVGVFWSKLFGIRVISTTHNLYQFPPKGPYRNFAEFIFSESDHVLTLSEQSRQEIIELGVGKNKVTKFIYWIDLNKFKPKFKPKKEFIVLFVGRLVEVKGIRLLINSAKNWDHNISLQIIGTGPLEEFVKNSQTETIKYLGKIKNQNLVKYYSQASLVVVPSTNEEGFGRVILESLACGTPVIASNLGGIPEAMNNSVGKLINPTEKSIQTAVEYYYKNRNKLKLLSKNAVEYAKANYSEKNVQTVINSYTS